MAPLPPNPISGLLGGSNTPVSPPKPSSAPPGPQPVDSSPMGSLPITLAPKGKLALPPNPITSSLLSAPKVKAVPVLMEGRPGHQHPAGAMDQFQQEAQAAAAPAVADYNKRSGGTQGIVPGMKAEDLAQLRKSASQNPEVAAAMGNLTNPESLVVGAVHGAKDVAGGLEKVVHGNLGGGAAQAGLGALGVAGILPFGKFGEIGDLAAQALRGRTAEDAAAHVLDASHNAIAEGHLPNAGGIGQVPKLKVGEVTPETGGEPGGKVREALHGPNTKGMGTYEKVGANLDQPQTAAQALKDQKALYNRGRTEQVTKGLAAREAAGGGLAGHYAERAAQAGALPKVPFANGLQELDQHTLEGLFRHAQTTTALKPFEQGDAVDALIKLTQGSLPTKSEQILLERAFGRETADGLRSITKDQWKTLAVDILNVPRALMASADLSAPLRQGLFALVSHPVMASKSFIPMMKSAFSERYFQEGIMGEIHGSVYYPLAQKGGLAVTDIGKTAGGAISLGGREEQRMSNLAEHMPGNNPLSKLFNKTIGNVVRGSDRAYVGFLDKLRMDYFSRLVTDAAQQGRDVNDERLLTDIAKVVNQATGRGHVGPKLQEHLATMNALFFAPRLMKSRIDMLNPLYYARLDPFARREALRNFAAMGGTALTILELAKLAGAKVNTDPTNADFAKIKLGNTRIDILGGEQQYIRLAAQLYKNKITSSTTGNVIPLGTGFAKTSRFDVVRKFLEGKFSPVPAIIDATLHGQDFTGKPVKWSQLSTYERALGNYMVPFLAQDLHDLYTYSGPNGLFAGPLDLFGAGIQAYKAKTPSSSGGSAPSDSYGDTGGSYGDSGSGGYGDSGSSYGG